MLAHWVCGGGWLRAHGTLDFAGGVPVEMASGFSAFAAALAVGRRKDYGRQALLPHNAVYVLLGAGLLWFGWFGFNGGSGYSARSPERARVHQHAARASLHARRLVRVRPVRERPGDGDRRGHRDHRRLRRRSRRPPASSAPAGRWLLGAVAALPCYAAILRRPRTRLDETLDVLGAHGLAGVTGILFIGFFAPRSWNGVRQRPVLRRRRSLGWQAAGRAGRPGVRVRDDGRDPPRDAHLLPLRVSEREEALGMDVVQHGEEAYNSG